MLTARRWFLCTAVLAGVAGLLLAAGCAGSAHGPRPGNSPAAAGGRWWHPPASGPDHGPDFQWMLDHALDVHHASDMGGAGRAAVFDIDGIINPASTVRSLHQLGDKVICYVEVGAAGDYYSAAAEGVRDTYFAQLRAAGDLGRRVPGYPEYYLDINAASTLRIVESMIREQCAGKGFDAVEPDIDDSYADPTGFAVTEAANIRYDKVLGAYAHSLGLAWGQKNGDADRQFSAALEPSADFLLDEECNFFGTCGLVAPPYVEAGKLVLDAEYTGNWGGGVAEDLGRFCAFDASHHIDGTLFTRSLAGPRYPCRLHVAR